jgi:hypothetical protein
MSVTKWWHPRKGHADAKYHLGGRLSPRLSNLHLGIGKAILKVICDDAIIVEITQPVAGQKGFDKNLGEMHFEEFNS